MEPITRSKLRWYQIKTVLLIAVALTLGAPFEGIFAFFGGSLLFEWLRQRDRKIQEMKFALGLGQYKEVKGRMEINLNRLQTSAAKVSGGIFDFYDAIMSGCPTCGTQYSTSDVKCSSEPTLCTNLRDIHPHYVNDPSPEPNPWAWSWYQRHGYAPPSAPCTKVISLPSEAFEENPAAVMAEAGRAYWSEHRNHFWDEGYAVAPQWYVDTWLGKAA